MNRRELLLATTGLGASLALPHLRAMAEAGPVRGYQNFWQAYNAGTLFEFFSDRAMGGVASWSVGSILSHLFPDNQYERWFADIGEKLDQILAQNKLIIQLLERMLYRIEKIWEEGQILALTRETNGRLSYLSILIPQMKDREKLSPDELNALAGLQKDAYVQSITCLQYGGQAYLAALGNFYIYVRLSICWVRTAPTGTKAQLKDVRIFVWHWTKNSRCTRRRALIPR
jgi:hypothetical protein